MPGSERAAAEISVKVYMDSPISSYGSPALESVEIAQQPSISDAAEKLDLRCFPRLLKVGACLSLRHSKASGKVSSVGGSTSLRQSKGTNAEEGDPSISRSMEARQML